MVLSVSPPSFIPGRPLNSSAETLVVRRLVDRLEQGDVNTIGKEHFTSLYSPARKRAFTPKNIKAGFAASGLFPFNPDRVLRSMPAPVAEPAIPTADENLARHLQKYTKAFQTFSAKSILQEDRIQFLTTINNEAKVRRSTRSLMLRKAKVMSYEDLEEAQAKRAIKAAKGKGKRGPKRKSGTPEADEGTADTARRSRKRQSAAQDLPKPSNRVARALATASAVQVSATPIAENEIVPALWSMESSSGANGLAEEETAACYLTESID
ncbi:hypothetical protein IFR05_005114 [Cadophora sp. M221]|nr:hypothetical protein IFR05_005114 [Cadophora sp. M221]